MLEVSYRPLTPYNKTLQQMQRFTQGRHKHTIADQLWILQHPSVFTQGLAGKPEHLLNANNIPVIQSDRGGQITYHGPGQLIAYPLLDLNKLKIGPKTYVNQLESWIIAFLDKHNIRASRQKNAPGIYVNQKKICSIGLRVRKGFSYHGIALNINMDLTPFSYINPCGFSELKMCQLSEFVPNISFDDIKRDLVNQFIIQFQYNNHRIIKTEEALT